MAEVVLEVVVVVVVVVAVIVVAVAVASLRVTHIQTSTQPASSIWLHTRTCSALNSNPKC